MKRENVITFRLTNEEEKLLKELAKLNCDYNKSKFIRKKIFENTDLEEVVLNDK